MADILDEFPDEKPDILDEFPDERPSGSQSPLPAPTPMPAVTDNRTVPAGFAALPEGGTQASPVVTMRVPQKGRQLSASPDLGAAPLSFNPGGDATQLPPHGAPDAEQLTMQAPQASPVVPRLADALRPRAPVAGEFPGGDYLAAPLIGLKNVVMEDFIEPARDVGGEVYSRILPKEWTGMPEPVQPGPRRPAVPLTLKNLASSLVPDRLAGLTDVAPQAAMMAAPFVAGPLGRIAPTAMKGVAAYFAGQLAGHGGGQIAGQLASDEGFTPDAVRELTEGGTRLGIGAHAGAGLRPGPRAPAVYQEPTKPYTGPIGETMYAEPAGPAPAPQLALPEAAPRLQLESGINDIPWLEDFIRKVPNDASPELAAPQQRILDMGNQIMDRLDAIEARMAPPPETPQMRPQLPPSTVEPFYQGTDAAKQGPPIRMGEAPDVEKPAWFDETFSAAKPPPFTAEPGLSVPDQVRVTYGDSVQPPATPAALTPAQRAYLEGQDSLARAGQTNPPGIDFSRGRTGGTRPPPIDMREARPAPKVADVPPAIEAEFEDVTPPKPELEQPTYSVPHEESLDTGSFAQRAARKGKLVERETGVPREPYRGREATKGKPKPAEDVSATDATVGADAPPAGDRPPGVRVMQFPQPDKELSFPRMRGLLDRARAYFGKPQTTAHYDERSGLNDRVLWAEYESRRLPQEELKAAGTSLKEIQDLIKEQKANPETAQTTRKLVERLDGDTTVKLTPAEEAYYQANKARLDRITKAQHTLLLDELAGGLTERQANIRGYHPRKGEALGKRLLEGDPDAMVGVSESLRSRAKAQKMKTPGLTEERVLDIVPDDAPAETWLDHYMQTVKERTWNRHVIEPMKKEAGKFGASDPESAYIHDTINKRIKREDSGWARDARRFREREVKNDPVHVDLAFDHLGRKWRVVREKTVKRGDAAEKIYQVEVNGKLRDRWFTADDIRVYKNIEKLAAPGGFEKGLATATDVAAYQALWMNTAPALRAVAENTGRVGVNISPRHWMSVGKSVAEAMAHVAAEKVGSTKGRLSEAKLAEYERVNLFGQEIEGGSGFRKMVRAGNLSGKVDLPYKVAAYEGSKLKLAEANPKWSSQKLEMQAKKMAAQMTDMADLFARSTGEMGSSGQFVHFLLNPSIRKWSQFEQHLRAGEFGKASGMVGIPAAMLYGLYSATGNDPTMALSSLYDLPGIDAFNGGKQFQIIKDQLVAMGRLGKGIASGGATDDEWHRAFLPKGVQRITRAANELRIAPLISSDMPRDPIQEGFANIMGVPKVARRKQSDSDRAILRQRRKNQED